MKKLSVIVSFLLIVAFCLTACSVNNGGDKEENPTEAGKIFYVSPDGNDSNDGSESAPFATVSGAKEAIKNLKTTDGLPDGGVTVYFKSGTYAVNSTLTFTEEDSGEDGKPIVYCAAPDADVVFDGGVKLNSADFIPAADDIKAQLFDENAAENLLEIDLEAAGCYDFEDAQYSSGWESFCYRQELYADGKRQTIARWPNTGFNYVETCGEDEDSGDAWFEIPADKAENLKDAQSFCFYGCPKYDWSSQLLFLNQDNVDVENSRIVFRAYNDHFSHSSTYYLFNILPEIDVPGEYYLDYENKKLYYYPDGSIDGKNIYLSQYKSEWFVFSGASHIEFESFSFRNARSAVFASGDVSDYISINNCNFNCLGTYAISVNGNNFSVCNNVITELGAGGIKIYGGDLAVLTYANDVISNNLIHDWSQTYTVYNPAINVIGFGFTVAHNELYNSPHEAIAFNCGGSVIEYNYVHNVCQQTSDAGALYSGRRWDWRGNHIRYNYIKDIVDVTCGGSPNGIYLDDELSGQYCYGNIIENVGGGAFAIGGGRDVYVYNNIIINTNTTGAALSLGDRGIGWAADTCAYPTGYLWTTLIGNDYSSRLQRWYFPQNTMISELSTLSHGNIGTDPGTPAYNYVCRNVCLSPSSEKSISASGDFRSNDIKSFGDISKSAMKFGTFCDNVSYVTDTDLGFEDAENGNYNMRDDSIILRDIVGFEKIPFDEIGLLK